MSELIVSLIELAGLVCLVVAALLVSVPLGVAVAGVALLAVARGLAA